MKDRLYLKRIPRDKEINTALHQDEGIILELLDGTIYTFVPTYELTEDGSIKGKYCRIENGKFTDKRGEAGLYIADTDTPEPIAWLTFTPQKQK